jgi:hypothetical protein
MSSVRDGLFVALDAKSRPTLIDRTTSSTIYGQPVIAVSTSPARDLLAVLMKPDVPQETPTFASVVRGKQKRNEKNLLRIYNLSSELVLEDVREEKLVGDASDVAWSCDARFLALWSRSGPVYLIKRAPVASGDESDDLEKPPEKTASFFLEDVAEDPGRFPFFILRWCAIFDDATQTVNCWNLEQNKIANAVLVGREGRRVSAVRNSGNCVATLYDDLSIGFVLLLNGRFSKPQFFDKLMVGEVKWAPRLSFAVVRSSTSPEITAAVGRVLLRFAVNEKEKLITLNSRASIGDGLRVECFNVDGSAMLLRHTSGDLAVAPITLSPEAPRTGVLLSKDAEKRPKEDGKGKSPPRVREERKAASSESHEAHGDGALMTQRSDPTKRAAAVSSNPTIEIGEKYPTRNQIFVVGALALLGAVAVVFKRARQ